MRLIDADALMVELMDSDLDHLQRDDWKEVIQIVADAPTIEQPQWIPVSERLPEDENKAYWVCTDTGYQCECRWTNVNPIWTDLTTDWHWNIFDVPQYTKVVAWMPLPKAYEVTE